MDDFYIIHKDKNYLKLLLKDIVIVLNDLQLELNINKTHIIKLTHNFVFLKHKYFICNNKLIETLCRGSITRERQKLIKYNSLHLKNINFTKQDIYNCYKSWRNNNLNINSYKTICSLDNLCISILSS